MSDDERPPQQTGSGGLDPDGLTIDGLDIDALDAGADPMTVLEGRSSRADAAKRQALADLRAVMSDEDSLAVFGIDVNQA